MKILFDATELSYFNEISGYRAGVFFVAFNLYKELKKLGIDIMFVCHYRRYYFLKNIKEFSSIKLLKENSLINRLFAKIFYFIDKFPIRIKYLFLIFSRFYDEYLYRTNKKNIEQLKEFDVYFSPYTPPVREIEESNIKKFRMIHDIIPILEYGIPKTPKDWYFRVYNNINSDDYYVTNSENTRNDVIHYFNIDEKHIKTTYLAANENFHLSVERNPIEGEYIFSLCTLGKRKNLEFGIRNFFKFIEKNNIEDLKLVLGGSVWKKYESELNKILKQYDKTKIVFAGYIDESELAKYYSNALCFIYPSLYEGFGLPVLEAMQCGCPVITSNNSSLPEVIGDSGIQINPKSDEEMISAYERMYFDSSFREECRKKGLERAKLFSWEKCAKEILNFIEQNTPSK